MLNRRIVILSGAGMSAESGISTFRDSNGLWEGHDVMQVASPEGWAVDPELVLNFYNLRRRQLKEVEPNEGHRLIAKLEKNHSVTVITQNVDDLHERAGSSNVIHLHGELRKVRSTGNPDYILNWNEDVNLNDHCPQGYQLRPHIVWFGEAVPKIEEAIPYVQDADVIIVIGTSLQVYPAAGLTRYAQAGAEIYYIDPNPEHQSVLGNQVTIIKDVASKGMQTIYNQLMEN